MYIDFNNILKKLTETEGNPVAEIQANEQQFNPFDVYNAFYSELNNEEKSELNIETFNKIMSGEIESDDELALNVIQIAQTDEDKENVSLEELEAVYGLYNSNASDNVLDEYINMQFEEIAQMYLGKSASECTSEELNQAYALNIIEGILLDSQAKLKHQDKLDGKLSEIYDAKKELFNTGTCQKDVEEALTLQEDIFNGLKTAILEGDFQEKYKELTGVEFDINKIIEYRETTYKVGILNSGITNATSFIQNVSLAGNMEDVLNLYTQYYKDEEIAKEKLNSFLIQMQEEHDRPAIGFINENNEFVIQYYDSKGNIDENSSQIYPLNKTTNWLSQLENDYFQSMPEVKNFVANFEKAFDINAEELIEKSLNLSKETLGEADKVTSILNEYIQEQESFLDKQAQTMQYIGLGLMIIGAGAAILAPSPEAKALGGYAIKIGQGAAITGTFGDNIAEAYDLRTNNYHGQGEWEAYKALLDETFIDVALFSSGYAIGKFSNSLADDVVNGLDDIITSEAGKKLTYKVADIGSDAFLSLTADYLITGDLDLLGEGRSQFISILTGTAYARLNNAKVNTSETEVKSEIDPMVTGQYLKLENGEYKFVGDGEIVVPKESPQIESTSSGKISTCINLGKALFKNKKYSTMDIIGIIVNVSKHNYKLAEILCNNSEFSIEDTQLLLASTKFDGADSILEFHSKLKESYNFSQKEVAQILPHTTKANVLLAEKLCSDGNISAGQIRNILKHYDYHKIDYALETYNKLKQEGYSGEEIGHILALRSITEEKITIVKTLCSDGKTTEKEITSILKSNLHVDQIPNLYKYCDMGLDIGSAIRLSENNIDLTSTIPLVKVDTEAQKNMFTYFFANNSHDGFTPDTIIKSADFTKYGTKGLELSYSRQDFLANISKTLQTVDDTTKESILAKLGIAPKYEGSKIVGYDGFIDLSQLSKEGIEGEVLKEATKFIKENSISTGNSDLDKALNSLIQGMPEFINIIGKQQHTGHSYSLDIHILETLKNAMNDPEYEALSDFDKTRLKLMTILHDIGKPEGVKDSNHDITSANFTNSILQRYNISTQNRYRIMNLIFNHHWNEKISKASDASYATAQTATLIGNEQDVNILKIFAQADIASIGKNTNFDFYGDELSLEINKIYEQRPLAYSSPIIPERFDSEKTRTVVTYEDNGTKKTKTIYALNLSKLPDDTDMSQYGFPETRADEILLAVHGANSNSHFNTYSLLQNPLATSPQSISLVSKDHHPTFKLYGMILDVTGRNVINATHYDQGCGTAKDSDTLTHLATGNQKYEAWRATIPNIIKDKLNIDDTAYSELARKITERTGFISPESQKTYTVTDANGKTIQLNASDVRKAIIEANLELTQMADEKAPLEVYDGRHHAGDITEYVTTQALPTGIYYARFDSIEDAMRDIDFQNFFAELPEGARIIFGGKNGYTYSSHQIWETTGASFKKDIRKAEEADD